jgi:hypothetical protein
VKDLSVYEDVAGDRARTRHKKDVGLCWDWKQGGGGDGGRLGKLGLPNRQEGNQGKCEMDGLRLGWAGLDWIDRDDKLRRTGLGKRRASR